MKYTYFVLFLVWEISCCHGAPDNVVHGYSGKLVHRKWEICNSPLPNKINHEFEGLGKAPELLRTGTNATDEEKVLDILRLLELGRSEMNLTESEIVLVIGMTRAGKSTITKFVAGEENQLEAVETDEGWAINDRYGDSVGNHSSISKTLLPELTIDGNGMAFYDCPGYSDTRNESVEIANSFFIKMVVDHSTTLKIVIVVPHGSLNEGVYIRDLLKQLVVFIRDVDKFNQSIALVVNFVNRDNIDTNEIRFIRNKLIRIRGELSENDFSWEHLSAARKIIDIITATDQDEDPIRIGIMHNVNHEGILDTMKIYQCLKPNIQNIVSNNIAFREKVEDDFGYALSLKAKMLIQNLVRSIDQRIISNLTELASEVTSTFQRELDSVKDGGAAIDPNLKPLLLNLFSAHYPNCEGPRSENLTKCVVEIETNWFTFSEPTPVFEFIKNNSEYLNFFAIASEAPIDVNTLAWAAPLTKSADDVLNYIDRDVAPALIRRVYDGFSRFFDRAKWKLLDLIRGENSIKRRKLALSQNISRLGSLKINITEMLDSPDLTLTAFINQSVEHLQAANYSDIIDVRIIQDLLPSAYFIEGLAALEWIERHQWVQPLQALVDALTSETKWITDFAESLYNELGDEKFQVQNIGDLRIWWRTNRPLYLTRFGEFWETFRVTITIGTKPMEEVFNAVSNDTRKLDTLNALLDTMLYLNFECSTCDTCDTAVAKGIFVSADNVKSCITGKKRGVILAFHTFFMSEELIINDGKSGTNLLIAAPLVAVRGTQVLNLNGAKGDDQPAQDSQPTGRPGLPGKPGWKAGNAFIVGQRIQGVITVNVNGGRGGTGQTGATGTRGNDGSRQLFSTQNGENTLIIEDDCAAWKGGKIQVRLHPHRCSPPEKDEPSMCHADDYAEYWIEGTHGDKGGRGGNGGIGGLGGVSGVWQQIELGKEASQSSTGEDGENGTNGAGGSGGSGGRKGATNYVRIDDRTNGNKECKMVGSPLQKEEPVNEYADVGERGPDGAQATPIDEPIRSDYNKEEFRTYLQNYITEAKVFYGNEYLAEMVKEFVLGLQGHASVPV